MSAADLEDMKYTFNWKVKNFQLECNFYED